MTKILVANRGEIAVRVMRTCRDMGIATVAVFSDADASAPHVAAADEAIHIGASQSGESYLSISKLLDAAQRAGADAIHPGYGFLSENGAFAEACGKAGLTFIGPRPQTIRAMGAKKEAKAIAQRAGVAVVPGYDGTDQSVAAFSAKANEIGFPVLLKASAGGGGKGMRIVRAPGELASAFEGAKREAQNAFGDDTLILEKYIERPRHVEIQILGDEHDNLVHLFERECSIQRRHQKIIEESPSPALDADLRYRMGRAAVDVARAIDYSSAGTVEFILAPDGKFYFLEVNTRLQVEHPVTELITGLDLVREQIRIARGETLGYGQQDLKQSGAAMECRLCAEDPDQSFMPAIGTVLAYQEPQSPGVRVDSGIAIGSVVGIHYDSMLAKIVTHGATRDEARERMERALRELVVLGVPTNRAYLLRVLANEEFRAGNIHTHFLQDTKLDALPTDTTAAIVACVLASTQERERARTVLPQIPSGYRNNFALGQHTAFVVGEGEHAVRYRCLGADAYSIEVDGKAQIAKRISLTNSLLTYEIDGHRKSVSVVADGERYFLRDGVNDIVLNEKPRFPDATSSEVKGACIAPMPGKVATVHVVNGQRIEKGAQLVVLEAMKMEHVVTASHAGTVRDVRVQAGTQVHAHEVLIVIDE